MLEEKEGRFPGLLIYLKLKCEDNARERCVSLHQQGDDCW